MNIHFHELKAQMKVMQDEMRKKLTKLTIQSNSAIEVLKDKEEKVFFSNFFTKLVVFGSLSDLFFKCFRRNKYLNLQKCAENSKQKKRKFFRFIHRL